jgi:hypothetical protein
MRLVKPLEEHPDLWQTLEAFLKAGLSLKRTRPTDLASTPIPSSIGSTGLRSSRGSIWNE